MIRLRSTLASLALAALALSSSSCVDATAPSNGSSSSSSAVNANLLGGVLGGGLTTVIDTTVTVLQRLIPLSADITQSAVIDRDGGSIAIPEAGFRLDVPKNAVDRPTTITVTAVGGLATAYEFEPQGMVFNKRLVFKQDLGLTAVLHLLGSGFKGAYFQSRGEISPTGTADIHELVPATTDLLSGTVQFPIKHFSGYLVAVD
jgi:hypothetical protein